MCFYYYSAEVYDDNFTSYTETGYTVGKDYKNALNNLTEYYGEDDIVKITLEYVADKPVLVLPPEDSIVKKGLVAAIKNNNDF